jgi:hypothetical protein
MHDRGHKGLRERAARPVGWLRRRWRRAVLVVAVLTVVVPLGSDAARSAMSGDGWSLGEAFGTGLAGEVDFDEIEIDEPLPDEVVDAGFAPDPEFFSDDEIIDSLGDGEIPPVALEAYLQGSDVANDEYPGCGLPWSVLAAIGRVESNHGRFGGAMLRADGYGTKPIRGIALDGRLGIARVDDSDGGGLDGDPVFDRAVGPMQIIPSTWDAVGVDVNLDDRTDPNNFFDAAGGAGIYLCNGDVDLTEPGQLARAVRRYNHTDEYVRVVLELASAYDSGEIEPYPGLDPASLGETPMDPVIFEDFEDVDPAPFADEFDEFDDTPPVPAGPRAPAPPAPPAPQPDPTPSPPAPTPTTTPPAPTPTTQPSVPTTTTTTNPPTAPTTPPGGPGTTVPPAPGTTVPGGPGTTVPPAPGTTVPGDPDTSTTVPASPPTTSPAGDTSSSVPPASVGWSPTMLDFVTDTVAERAAECSAPEPSPAPTQPSVPAPNPTCPATPPEEQG